jgi:hypothetical protein
MKAKPFVIASFAVLVAMSLGAQSSQRQVPLIEAERAECFPPEVNGVAYATIDPEVGGVSTRLYFRWDEDEDFYFVPMRGVGNGRYWAVPPKPKGDNEGIEYYVALIDPLGEMLSKSESLHSPVTKDCEVELDEQQQGMAENMTVGETTFEQVGEEVDGFLCDGIVNRINPDGVLRGDERCRACVIAWWQKQGIILPTAGALVGSGAIITRFDRPKASPADP